MTMEKQNPRLDAEQEITNALDLKWYEGYLAAMQKIRGALSRIGKNENEIDPILNAEFFCEEGIRVAQIRISQLKDVNK